jgi:hypothetical protein
MRLIRADSQITMPSGASIMTHFNGVPYKSWPRPATFSTAHFVAKAKKPVSRRGCGHVIIHAKHISPQPDIGLSRGAAAVFIKRLSCIL